MDIYKQRRFTAAGGWGTYFYTGVAGVLALHFTGLKFMQVIPTREFS